MTNRLGALPDTLLTKLIEGNNIIGADTKHVSPASLDLTVSAEIYKIRGLVLPKVGESIRDLMPFMEAEKADIAKPLQCDGMYLAKLNESLDLPGQVYGYCNPKSSTGRLDMHVRVLADGVPRYDSITPKGYKGDLWVELRPNRLLCKFTKEHH